MSQTTAGASSTSSILFARWSSDIITESEAGDAAESARDGLRRSSGNGLGRSSGHGLRRSSGSRRPQLAESARGRVLFGSAMSNCGVAVKRLRRRCRDIASGEEWQSHAKSVLGRREVRQALYAWQVHEAHASIPGGLLAALEHVDGRGRFHRRVQPRRCLGHRLGGDCSRAVSMDDRVERLRQLAHCVWGF